MIKVLFIGGVFAEENIPEIVASAKGTVEYSANIFQERLITGFRRKNIQFEVVSAPFIGAFPMRSNKIVFRGFEKKQNKYRYVPFVNIWGYRNISRAYSMKKNIKAFAEEKNGGEKIIIVYSAHAPFLEAAVYAKKIDPSIKICFVVPDLPQYMNLDKNRTFLYDVLKKFDIAHMEKLIQKVDSFVVLTEQMKEVLSVQDRPALIVEGITEIGSDHVKAMDKQIYDEKNIVYTGKLNEMFGVKDLVDAFLQIENPQYRLVLCGNGDCVSYIETMAKHDNRILYVGQVTPDKAKEWQQSADVLINPRKNNEEYTKYSFPSKTIEYLLTGNPVVAYKLDGMKDCYREYLYIIDDENRISDAIQMAMNASIEEKEEKHMKFMNYALNNLNAENIAEEIIRLNR